MINKKLSTSLCDITFSFGEYNNPSQYQLFFDNACTQRINLPAMQHKYLYDKVDAPVGILDNTELYIKSMTAGTVLKYAITWDWNFDNLVQNDMTITASFEEIKYTLSFEYSEPSGYVYKSGCAREAKPAPITNIPNNGIIPVSQQPSFGNDYTKNEFEFGTPSSSDGKKHRFSRIAWNTRPDGSGSAFVFGQTPITDNTTIYPVWTIKTWTITIDYNKTYYNDKIKSWIPNNEYYTIHDRFTFKGSPTYNLSTARSKLTRQITVTDFYYLSEQTPSLWRNNNNVIIRTFPDWYTDTARTIEFNFSSTVIESSFSIYAKWGNVAAQSYILWIGDEYDNTARNFSKHSSQSSAAVLTIPSFCNSAQLAVTSGGGNSKHIYGAEVKPAKELVEIELSTPGGDGATDYFYPADYNKVQFEYKIGGSEATSYLKNKSTGVLKRPAAGANGGGTTDAGNTRFNLGDDGSSETAFTGGGTIYSYLKKRIKKNAQITTKTVYFTNGPNTTAAYFLGVCSNTTNPTMTVYYRYYLGDYWRDYEIGKIVYDVVHESDKSGTDWGYVWNLDWYFYNTNPIWMWYNGSSSYNGGILGKGGSATYLTCKNGTKSKANSSSFCYGNTGGITITFEAESIPTFS